MMRKFYFPRLIAVTLLVLSFFSSIAQTYPDGPIQLKVWVEDIKVQYTSNQPSDFSLQVGSLGLPGSLAADELTFNLWARDNADVDGLGWQGGNCLTANMAMANGGPDLTPEFNDTLFNHTYTAATVPQFFDIRLRAWEDDINEDFAPAGNLTPCSSAGGRCSYEASLCCLSFFGNCILTEGDDYYCDADPFKVNMDYRRGSPCEYYLHGYVVGSGCTDNFYQPQIGSFWRYTKGTGCTGNQAIDLGTLNPGGAALTHFNSNECYTNNFPSSPGNDVFYSFTITNPIGVTISLCGTNTTFDTRLYLLNSSCAIDTSDDDGCGTRSIISKSLCAPGTYYVVVDGKTALSAGTFDLVISENTSFNFSATTTVQNISCFGANDGEATVNITGGVAPYGINWPGTIPDVASVTGLAAGSYTVTITDAEGCSTTAIATITQPTQLGVTTTATNVSCGGANDGSATATPTGGTGPYSYLWNSTPPQTSQTAVLLPAGTFNVTVTDANGCTASASTTVSPTTTVIITVDDVNNISCFGAGDGSISLSINGGQTPYTYTWSNGLPATQDQTGLDAGIYTVTVRDALLCEATATFNITEPDLLQTVVNTIINVSCQNSDDGAVDLGVSGGTVPYTYAWSNNGGTGEELLGAEAGTYTVTVTDANGCTTTETATITSTNAAITSSITHTNANCETNTLGTADLTVNGGAGGFTFFWSNFATSEDVTALDAGTYSVVITDADNCFVIDTVTIAELAAPGVCDSTTDTTVMPSDRAFVMAPNVFTPNDDNMNQLFSIYTNKATSVEVIIFNRLGAQVYYNANQPSGANDGWDGTHNGKKAPEGTYVYVFNIKYDDGTDVQKTGTVLLLR
jgi:gliding motility-associated-like protein